MSVLPILPPRSDLTACPGVRVLPTQYFSIRCESTACPGVRVLPVRSLATSKVLDRASRRAAMSCTAKSYVSAGWRMRMSSAAERGIYRGGGHVSGGQAPGGKSERIAYCWCFLTYCRCTPGTLPARPKSGSDPPCNTHSPHAFPVLLTLRAGGLPASPPELTFRPVASTSIAVAMLATCKEI